MGINLRPGIGGFRKPDPGGCHMTRESADLTMSWADLGHRKAPPNGGRDWPFRTGLSSRVTEQGSAKGWFGTQAVKVGGWISGSHSRANRLDWAALLIITLLAAGLRMWDWSKIGLSHFDEGIYAISGELYWAAGRFEPFQAFYSPPIYPWLISVVNMLAGGGFDRAGVLISIIAGTLLPIAGWLLAGEIRLAFLSPASTEELSAGEHGQRSPLLSEDQIARLGSGLLLALSGPVIVFSRAGLTDSTFTLGVLFTLAMVGRSIRLGTWASLFWAICAGCFTWNVKYNGSMAILASFAFVLSKALFQTAESPSKGQMLAGLALFRRWLIFAIMCFLSTLPWLYFVHQQHGYHNLIAHQAGYVRGVWAIPNNLMVASQQASALELLSFWIVFEVLALASLLIGGPRWLKVLGLAISVGLAFLGWMVAPLIGLSRLIGPAFDRFRGDGEPPLGRSAGLIWLVLVFALPAIYTPYQRLWLPTSAVLIVLTMVGLARGFGQSTGSNHTRGEPTGKQTLAGSERKPHADDATPIGSGSAPWLTIGSGIAIAGWLLAIILSFALFRRPADRRWLHVSHAGDRAAFPRLQELLNQHAGPKQPVATLVKPTLLYYLRDERLSRLSGSANDFVNLPTRTLLLVDSVSADSAAFRAEVAIDKAQSKGERASDTGPGKGNQPSWTKLGEVATDPSLPTILDYRIAHPISQPGRVDPKKSRLNHSRSGCFEKTEAKSIRGIQRQVGYLAFVA